MSRIGLLLVGHGGGGEQREVMQYYADRLAKAFDAFPVGSAFLYGEEPDIQEGVRELADRNVNSILVVPILLFHGINTLQRIPESLGMTSGDKRGTVDIDGSRIEILLVEPIGCDQRLVDVMESRIRERM